MSSSSVVTASGHCQGRPVLRLGLCVGSGARERGRSSRSTVALLSCPLPSFVSQDGVRIHTIRRDTGKAHVWLLPLAFFANRDGNAYDTEGGRRGRLNTYTRGGPLVPQINVVLPRYPDVIVYMRNISWSVGLLSSPTTAATPTTPKVGGAGRGPQNNGPLRTSCDAAYFIHGSPPVCRRGLHRTLTMGLGSKPPSRCFASAAFRAPDRKFGYEPVMGLLTEFSPPSLRTQPPARARFFA